VEDTVRKESLSRYACKIAGALLLSGAAIGVASSQTFVVLHDFSGPDGSAPTGPLVQGSDGKYYGMTEAGGTTFGIDRGPCRTAGCGTVFKIGRYGAVTTLYNFCPQVGCPDGARPLGAMAEGTFGSFFGVAMGGGFGLDNQDNRGTAFRITPGQPEATLYTFCSLTNCRDGSGPNSIIEGWDGSFHGTTAGGGSACCSISAGTVYRLTPGGKLTTSYAFCKKSAACPDGSDPQGLIQGADGNLYGFTMTGGIQKGEFHSGAGTIFKIAESGFATVYSFCAQTLCSDGATPVALIQGADGNLYGATQYGGAAASNGGSGSGTIFKLGTDGTLTTLYTFCKSGSGCSDGGDTTSLIQGSDGNFYGTTPGTVFEVTPEGAFTITYSLLSYEGSPNSLMQGTDGAFYGTALGGGKTGRGTIFRLDTGLGPFVHPVLAFGKVGATVVILGTNLTGTTGVSFNGTAATFKVDSATSIATTVPSGSTTGSITVTTPSGTLTSNVSFTVLP